MSCSDREPTGKIGVEDFAEVPRDLFQCLAVVVLPDPGALARVIEPFAKLGLIPHSVNCRHFAKAQQLAIDIQVVGLTREQGARIASLIGSFPITLSVVLGR